MKTFLPTRSLSHRITLVVVGLLALTIFSAAAMAQPGEALAEIRKIDARFSGNIGVYIKNLADGETVEYQADRPWYLASVTKIPIAIAFLRAVEQKRFTLGYLTALRDSDKVDGTGGLQSQKQGTLYSFDYLLEQMITWSDSTAADMLVRLLGVRELNRDVARFGGGKISTITSLLDVRREAYSEMHRNARYLPNSAFFALKRAESNEAKLAVLSAQLNTPPKRFATQSVNEAFERYYERGLNSGTLAGLGNVLELLARGKILQEDNAKYLLRIMSKTNTGKERILGGLPKGTVFAHKTGTQTARICDAGLVLRPNEIYPQRSVIAIACTEKFASRADAERALREVGKVISRHFLPTVEYPGRLSSITP